MKTLLLLLLTVASTVAQNWAVRWTGENTNKTPIYWPIIIANIGTNLTAGGAMVLTTAKLENVIKTNTSDFVKGVEIERSLEKERFLDFQMLSMTNLSMVASNLAWTLKDARDRTITIAAARVLITNWTSWAFLVQTNMLNESNRLRSLIIVP